MHIVIPAPQAQGPVAAAQLEQAILDKIRAIPGVTAVGTTTFIPTDPGGSHYQVYARDKTYDKAPLRRQKFVSPGLLAAFGRAPGYPAYDQVNFRLPGRGCARIAVPVHLTYLDRPNNESPSECIEQKAGYENQCAHETYFYSPNSLYGNILLRPIGARIHRNWQYDQRPVQPYGHLASRMARS